MPLPDTEESTFPHTEEQSLVQHVTSFEEWRALASAWPMKQLVTLWNDLPGIVPVQKFTNREIALERIWRSVHGSEGTANQSRREQKNPFREGSKAAQVYALLGRPEGAAENKVEQSVDQRSKRVMTTWPTGLGKTVLFSALPDTLGLRHAAMRRRFNFHRLVRFCDCVQSPLDAAHLEALSAFGDVPGHTICIRG